MSARAPFVPQSNAGGRPPSRVAQTPSSGSGHEKPFNTNGLRRSTAGTGSMSQDIHDFNRPRRVLAASQIHRPSTTEPSHHHTAPGLQIAAPAPRNAPSHNSLNEVLSSASHPNFKIPSLPSHTTDDLHTHEAVTLSVPLSDNAGPRRVLVETSGGQHSFPIDVDHDTGLSGDALRSSRRSKRSRAEFDSANESQHIEFNSSVHQSKKFKPNPDHKQTLTESNSRHSHARQDPSSPTSIHSHHSHYSHHSQHEVSNSHLDSAYASHDVEEAAVELTLDRLLRGDTDSFKKFEGSETHWKQCSMEEWKQGGDGIIAKYQQIMESVKDRLTTKLSLYTNLDDCIASHQEALEQRDRDLANAQDRLVKGSGNVIVGVQRKL